jgi:mRNA interferase RelE/StbE
MSYKILFTRQSEKDLSNLPKSDFRKVEVAIAKLADNPRPPKSKKLTARDSWRIRIGNYRVIYLIEDDNLIVIVIEIGHRKEVYK